MKIRNSAIIIALLMCIMVLSGCNNGVVRDPTVEEVNNSRFVLYGDDGERELRDYFIIVDMETGVQYLYVHNGGGDYSDGYVVTPLLNQDGTPYSMVE